jgi:hypothetical protein
MKLVKIRKGRLGDQVRYLMKVEEVRKTQTRYNKKW